MKKIYYPPVILFFLSFCLTQACALAHNANRLTEAQQQLRVKQARIAPAPSLRSNDTTNFSAQKQNSLLPHLDSPQTHAPLLNNDVNNTISLEYSPSDTPKEQMFVGHAKAPKESAEKGLGKQGDIFMANINWNDDLGNIEQPPEAFEKVSIDSSIDRTPGMQINVGARFKNIAISSSYTQAMELSSFNEFLSKEQDSEAKIWHGELAYTTDWMARELVFAFGYQKTIEAANLDVPGERYNTRASLFLSQATSLSLEYYQDKDNNIYKDTDEIDEHGIIARFGFTF